MRGGGLYINGGGNMNRRSFNDGWQRIMNLDLILPFGEIWCIKYGDWWEWEQIKFGFPVTIVTTYRANFEKSYLTQF